MADLETEFYSCGENVLLILTGLGGSVQGEQNKYRAIAENAVKVHGFSVFTVAIPHGAWENPEEIMRIAMSLLKDKMQGGFGDIYAMGNSAGATFLLWYAYMYPKIKKVLSINPVLNINLHRTNDGIKNFNGENIFIAVGERDASKVFAQFLRSTERVQIAEVDGADHGFTGKIQTFISLPRKFLFKNEK